MNLAKKFLLWGLIIMFIGFLVFYYLFYAFMAWNFNLTLWPPILRAGYAIGVVVVALFISYGWNRDKDKADTLYQKKHK